MYLQNHVIANTDLHQFDVSNKYIFKKLIAINENHL
jgi:hypothetical protein